MPSDKSKELPNNNENDPDFDRTEALKQALLKLKAEGKITELPSDVFGKAAEQSPVDVSIPMQPTTDETVTDAPPTMPDKVLDTERQIKRLHFSLGIHLKNQLTAEQQAKLRGMRMPPRPDGPPRPE